MKAYDNSSLLDFFHQQLQQHSPIIPPADGMHTAVTVDTLIEAVHFPVATPPAWVAHKALAVNLSDLAAMGASPVEISLGLIIPSWDDSWLQAFAEGLRALCKTWSLHLSRCHVSEGPLSVTIQAHGYVAAGKALRRSNARPGDQILVTGTLGDAACALPYYLQHQALPSRYQEFLQQRLNYPQPRVSTGLLLAGLANAAVDISDGLAADLGHILEESHVGARLQLEKLPASSATQALLSDEQRMMLQLGGGDDFELCFTIPELHVETMYTLLKDEGVTCTWIGEIVEGDSIEYRLHGEPVVLSIKGYDHFSADKDERL